MIKQTISIAFVREALTTVWQKGLYTDELLLQVGISPSLLDLPQSRISPGQYSSLWRAIALMLNDEFLGLTSRPMKIGAFSMLCHSVIHGETLEAGLRRALRFYSLIFDDIGATLSHDGNWVRIEIANHGRHLGLFAHSAFLQILHGLVSWLIGRRIAILKAEFCYDEPSHGKEYRAIFCPNTYFNQPNTAITFSARYLDMPIIQNKETLKDFLRYAPTSFLIKFEQGDTLSDRIRRHLHHTYVSEWPDFDAMARQLNMTPSTLRRRLEGQGQPYQSIKDDLRFDLAIILLDQPEKSVTDIAIGLGFSDTSAFYRAFKKWTGMSPTEYRSGLLDL
ncbi:MAG: AraC family transcriptional regulator [Gammaproteobacteria bacterium]|nr:AraC family transcriptional regulator [Gammaproteobacteria bacterium]